MRLTAVNFMHHDIFEACSAWEQQGRRFSGGRRFTSKSITQFQLILRRGRQPSVRPGPERADCRNERIGAARGIFASRTAQPHRHRLAQSCLAGAQLADMRR